MAFEKCDFTGYDDGNVGKRFTLLADDVTVGVCDGFHKMGISNADF